MKKKLIALLAAILITASVALAMLVVGANAMMNQNGTTVSSLSSLTVSTSSPTLSSDQAQIAQLQDLVAQYQAREQQYQAALDGENQQLSQAAEQMQMVQQLLAYLESHGLIRIDNQGQIYITEN
jgi:predicted PurR-regulated permease PerM